MDVQNSWPQWIEMGIAQYVDRIFLCEYFVHVEVISSENHTFSNINSFNLNIDDLPGKQPKLSIVQNLSICIEITQKQKACRRQDYIYMQIELMYAIYYQ